MTKINQFIVGAGLSLLAMSSLQASTAYGTLSNFDTVNDTGETTYGFEIEMEGCDSTDIHYTYDYNHYGRPTISTDKSDPARLITYIRYASKKDIDGNYLSFTNVPAGPLSATNGHQCTNPTVNEGCEHFGVSYRQCSSIVRYHWLIDDPAHPGILVKGAPVLVNTPVWNYLPPRFVNNVPQPAQVIPVIEAPEVEIPPVKEFGEASWVKVIKTTTHNPAPIALEELIGGDKDADGQPDWANHEPAEVETQWYLLQTSKGRNGGKQELQGGVEALPNDNETVTRRYEFYKYAGSAWTIDGEQGEAMCDEVAVDGLHGTQSSVGVTNANGGSHIADCTTAITTDVIADGVELIDYEVALVITGGIEPFQWSVDSLPAGLSLDKDGVIIGVPELGSAGTSYPAFSVTDGNSDTSTKTLSLTIAGSSASNPVVAPAPVINPVPAPVTGATGVVVELDGQVSEVGAGYFILNGVRVNYDVGIVQFEDGFGPDVQVGDPVQITGDEYDDGSVLATMVQVG